MTQPCWRLVTSGDDFALYEDTSNAYSPEVEIWESGDDSDDAHGYVYRFQIERCRVVTEINGEACAPIVTTDPAGNTYGPGGMERAYPEWFSDDVIGIAASIGSSADTLRADLAGDDVTARMWAYRAICGFHGVVNFDQYPIEMDQEDWDRRTDPGAHPMTAEVQAALAALNRTPPFAWSLGTDEDGDPIPNPDMYDRDEPCRMDVRLQVNANGSWNLHSGDSQYDQDHRGTWSSTTIPFTGDPSEPEFEPRRVANDLIDDLEFEIEECADCGGSTVDGSPEPHVCGEASP